jgi:hypothetical protein
MAAFPENQRAFIYIWNKREKNPPSFHCQLCSNQSTPSPWLPSYPSIEI